MTERLSFPFIKNYIYDLFKIRLNNNAILKPLMFGYYITFKCNFHCSYCTYANENIINNFNEELETEEIFNLLKIIRKSCPNLYITGGEPLLREDIIEVLKECKKLKFKMVSLISNMSVFHKNMGILDYLDNLSVSLDMIESNKYSKIVNTPENIIKKSIENITVCSKLQKEKNFTLTVNFVANDQTIPHAKDVLNFCLKNSIRFTIGPEIQNNGRVNEKIKNNLQYKELLKDVIKLRKSNKLILGSKLYHKTISDLLPFRCYPLLTPRIYPNGNFLYPCEPLKNIGVNMLKMGSYEKALKKAIHEGGPIPKCKDRCYKNCYVEPSNFLRYPFKTFSEYL